MTPRSKKAARAVSVIIIAAAITGVALKEMGYGRKPAAENLPQETAQGDSIFASNDPGADCDNCFRLYSAELTSKDPLARREAALELGGSASPKAERPLIKQLTDKDAAVRSNAAIGLGLLKSTAAVEPLYALADKDSTPEAKTSATAALGRIGTPEAVRALCMLLGKPNSAEFRNNVIIAISGTADASALMPLASALAQPETTNTAAAALVVMDLPGTAGETIKLIYNLNPEVRTAAQGVLEELMAAGSAQAAEDIRRNLDNIPPHLQSMAGPYLARF